VLFMVASVIERPVSDATDAVGAAPLDEHPLLREVRTSIMRSLISAFDPYRNSHSWGPACVFDLDQTGKSAF
jgi:hypothetical protein